MTSEPFRWGLIGPGRIAHQFARGLLAVKNAELYGIASRSEERAAAFARTYQAEKAYASYQTLVEDPNVDAVYIATPHRFHYEQALLCLKAGKAVLCEKPLTVNVPQASILIKAAREKRLFLMEALWTRFLPIYQTVRQWLDEKRIGEPELFTSTFGFKAPVDIEGRLYNPELAGGALLDIGIYNLSVSQWIMNADPVRVTAAGHIGFSGVDETTAASLYYKNGTISQFVCTIKADTPNQFVMYGDKGSIHIHAPFWAGTEASLLTEDHVETVKGPFRATGFEYEIEEAMSCIRAGRPGSRIMPLARTLSTLQVMDDIRRQIGLAYPFEKEDGRG